MSKKQKTSKFKDYIKTTLVYEYTTVVINFIKKHHNFLIIFVIAVFAVGIATYPIIDSMYNGRNTTSTEVLEKSNKSMLEQKIYVTISGEVENPGMYEMTTESRINDVIQKAGGFTENAYTENINLAQKLTDGQYINIVSKNYAESNDNTEHNNTPSKFYGIININTATVEELCQLPGIGEVTAKAIIEYRELAGEYECIEDIQNVKGIGPKKFNAIKYNITV